MINKKYYGALFTYVFFLGNLTWLIAPIANTVLSRGPNLISEYESVGMTYSSYFRLADFLVAIVLLLAVIARKKTISNRFNKRIVYFLYSVSLLEFVDALTPIRCNITNRVCTPMLTFGTYIHGGESFILSTITFVLAVFLASKYRRHIWLPLAMLACIVSGFILRNRVDSLLYGIQVMSSLLGLYVVWYLTVGDIFERTYSKILKSKITNLVAVFVAVNATFSLAFATTHIARRIPLTGFVFANNTAWLSEHTILSSLALLYLAKALWNGSNSAWRIVVFLVTLEFIKYSAITADGDRMFLYLLLLITLLISKGAFDRRQSTARFKSRIKQALIVISITLLTSTLLAAAFRIHSTRQWQRSEFTPNRVLVRTLLLEVRTDNRDPLKARLFSQALTSVGIFMYAWLFLGLFLPSLLPNQHQGQESVYDMELLLDKYSNNSEDSLKLWPDDKSYWFTNNKSSGVAYKQSGKYAFALADPIGPGSKIGDVISSFQEYCRQHGTTVCWLMVYENQSDYYEKAELQLLPIGSSAVVSVETFTDLTVKTKWWRWIRNKATKQGLTFYELTPPHSAAIISEIKYVSDQWLDNNNHSERSFALGYFDAEYLTHNTLYVLRDTSNKLIAFTNQLPTYGSHKRATIDLMRFLPDYDGIMAYLLSEIIIKLGHDNVYETFDLGFVPLAGIGQNNSSVSFSRFIKKVLKPLFSAHGLEQFKNKFDPIWHKNYIAYDGDYTDLPTLIIALQEVLQIKNDPTDV